MFFEQKIVGNENLTKSKILQNVKMFSKAKQKSNFQEQRLPIRPKFWLISLSCASCFWKNTIRQELAFYKSSSQ